MCVCVCLWVYVCVCMCVSAHVRACVRDYQASAGKGRLCGVRDRYSSAARGSKTAEHGRFLFPAITSPAAHSTSAVTPGVLITCSHPYTSWTTFRSGAWVEKARFHQCCERGWKAPTMKVEGLMTPKTVLTCPQTEGRRGTQAALIMQRGSD